MKKTLLSLFMLFGFGAFVVQAQITVTDANLVVAGDNVEQAHDTIPSVTIGSGGASQTWNFSGLNQHTLDTLKFRATPGGYPGAANFPLANLVLEQPIQDSTWMYLTKNPLGLFVVGMAQYQQGQLITIPITGTILTFPSTMGTNFNGNWSGYLYGFDVSGFSIGLDSIKVTRGTSTNSNIDGWGNVTTPFGTFASLRQIVYEESIDTTWEKSTISGQWAVVSATTIALAASAGITLTQYSYDTTRTARWWTDDPTAKFPIVEMDYEANGTVNQVDWQKSSPTVGVAELSVANGSQLYPNPAKESITIETKFANNNAISIFDVTGKLVNEMKFTTSKISLSVAELNNGIYFYNIYDVNGNVIQSNKFIVAK